MLRYNIVDRDVALNIMTRKLKQACVNDRIGVVIVTLVAQ